MGTDRCTICFDATLTTARHQNLPMSISLSACPSFTTCVINCPTTFNGLYSNFAYSL